MKIETSFKQPILIDTDREEAKALELELRELDLLGRPRLSEFHNILVEAERRFREREYRGPG